MNRAIPSAASALVATLAVLAGGGAAWGALQLEPVLQGLSSPLYVTQIRDGSRRFFIVEQGGVIKVLQPGATTPTVFLNITSRVLRDASERGLLGLAFHPGYATNGFFYVHYTDLNGDVVVARYHVSADPDVADPTSELILLTIPHPTFGNHNGGMVEFGPDGKLYVGVGDGGSGNDPPNNAQNVGQLLGKILRFDVDVPAPYVPTDNPFVGVPGARPEIWAFGLRNPFRFSFDRATGQLYVGDVGQGAFEEIDIVTRGGNYGWRVFEGFHCTNIDPALCGTLSAVPPIAEYGHTLGRCSIIGGYVYRGQAGTLPLGSYVYGDFCTGEIFLLQNGVQSVLLDTSLRISSFGEDASGEIYVVGLGGTVHRLVNFRGGVFVAAGDLDGDGTAEIITGAGEGGGPHVRAFGADGTPHPTSFFAYTPTFTGGVRVAACEFDTPADGRAEIVTGAGPGGGPHVRIIKLDGAGQPASDLASFFAYSPAFAGGVFVACGDVDGDGRVDVITGADAGGGPHVRAFSLVGGLHEVASFFAFAPQFPGGVRVAAGDVDGSGRASIVVAAGPGGGPHVKVLKLVGGVLQELASFFAYGSQFTGGVFVAAGDVLGDGRAEVVTGAGPGGGPHVRVFSGAGVDSGVSFFAYDAAFTGGVRVAVGGQLITGPGPGGDPQIRSFTGTGAPGSASFLAY